MTQSVSLLAFKRRDYRVHQLRNDRAPETSGCGQFRSIARWTPRRRRAGMPEWSKGFDSSSNSASCTAGSARALGHTDHPAACTSTVANASRVLMQAVRPST